MHINAVIGNPPYNNDMYIPFVEMGHQLATDCSLFITPAKWQAKGGKLNKQFRADIVPHMSKIVYYPDSRDIFDIKMQGGVCFYSIDKDIKNIAEIINICNKNSIINSVETRKIKDNNILLNKGISILDKINCYKKLITVRCDENDNYQVYMLNAYMNGAIMLNTGDTLLFAIMHTEEKNSIVIGNSEKLIFSSNSSYECKSYISYMQTKFIRFIAFMLIDGQQPKMDTIYSFIPDPGAFDHIFTDEELYKKYNLTDEEINIIESVIKERK